MKQIIRVFLLFGFYFTSALYAPPKEFQVRIPSADKPGTPVDSDDPDERELQQLDLNRSALDLDDVAERLSALLASPVTREQSVISMAEVETVEVERVDAFDLPLGSPRQLRGDADFCLHAGAETREFHGGAASSSSGHKKELKK